MKFKRIALVFLTVSMLITFSCKSTQILLSETDISGWNTNYTYVFVHGLSGWGHYDFLNNFFPYWGMKNGSLIKQLRRQGFSCYDASVAPQGSAWDRACELYAQLTGTKTDYGLEHSTRCGHERYGRDFSKNPLIPRWDSENKINILGHSFGGATVRLLAHLMSEGSEAERNATPENELSPLFAGGHADWIYSVTALAAPHNGTSAYHIPDENPDEKSSSEKMMEKTNAPKKDGRAEYDYADFDMHIQNAAEMNRWITTIKSAYYFSFPCSSTKTAEDGTQEPIPEITEKMLRRSSTKLGKFEGTTYDGIELSKEWQENDGLVNTISAMAPDFAPSKKYSETDGLELEKGIWYVMPTYRGDHMALQGGLTIRSNITELYVRHLNMINQLK